MVSNIDNVQACEHVQNMLDNLRTTSDSHLKLMFLYMAVPDILTDQTCKVYWPPEKS